MPDLPCLTDLSAFIDNIKNVFFALIFVLCGFYVTVTPGIEPGMAGQWLGAAMLVAGVYVGTRSEKGKSEAVVAQINAEERLEAAKAP
jgi:hypothetical protein